MAKRTWYDMMGLSDVERQWRAVEHNRSCRLLTITPELRNHIYKYVFDINITDIPIDIFAASPPPKAIIQSCRQLHNEAAGLYYPAYRRYWTETTFTIHPCSPSCTSPSLREQDLERVTRIQLTCTRESLSRGGGRSQESNLRVFDNYSRDLGYRQGDQVVFRRCKNRYWQAVPVEGHLASVRVTLTVVGPVALFLIHQTAPFLSGTAVSLSNKELDMLRPIASSHEGYVYRVAKSETSDQAANGSVRDNGAV